MQVQMWRDKGEEKMTGTRNKLTKEEHQTILRSKGQSEEDIETGWNNALKRRSW